MMIFAYLLHNLLELKSTDKGYWLKFGEVKTAMQ
jgi:hypothetical protein